MKHLNNTTHYRMLRTLSLSLLNKKKKKIKTYPTVTAKFWIPIPGIAQKNNRTIKVCLNTKMSS